MWHHFNLRGLKSEICFTLGFWLLFDQIPKDWNWHSICIYRIVHDNIIVHVKPFKNWRINSNCRP